MTRALRLLVLALCSLAILTLAWALAARFVYPYDLEWMEGGMLCHALRVKQGLPIYAAPSIDFIPFLYTPLYPTLLALLSFIVPLGYVLGRAVSLVAFIGTLALAYRFARDEGATRPHALLAIALPCAAFVPTGAWYDLARPDSLFLGLVVTALYIAWRWRDSARVVAASALLMVAAFFTKQTATPFMLGLGLALLVARPRALIPYVATLALTGLPLLYLLNRTSDGWFWTYVFRLHQSHAFYATRAFVGTPGRLMLLIGPGLLLIPLALRRDRSPGFLYIAWLAVVGIGISGVGFGTQWAFTNAFIPGILFGAIAIAVAASKLSARAPSPMVEIALALTLVLAPGGLQHAIANKLPFEWSLERDEPMGYDLRKWVPTARDRALGDVLIQKLAAAPGEVLIPFHPFYAHLAKKRTFLHRMGVLDISRARLPPPQGLAEGLAQRRFSLAVFDNKIDGNWFYWPGLRERYREHARLSGPRTFSGAQTEPRYVMVPLDP